MADAPSPDAALAAVGTRLFAPRGGSGGGSSESHPRAPSAPAAWPVCCFAAALFLRAALGLWPASGMSGRDALGGDFEAQRHWSELTVGEPLSRWYSYDTEYWGLDYPPLTYVRLVNEAGLCMTDALALPRALRTGAARCSIGAHTPARPLTRTNAAFHVQRAPCAHPHVSCRAYWAWMWGMLARWIAPEIVALGSSRGIQTAATLVRCPRAWLRRIRAAPSAPYPPPSPRHVVRAGIHARERHRV